MEKNKDLKWIQKQYGDGMRDLCRKCFPELLEKEYKGVLQKIFEDNFCQQKELAHDIEEQDMVYEFRTYVYSIADKMIGEKTDDKKIIHSNKTAKELLDEAGYILFDECQTEEDIQKFKKYYAQGEALCTFYGKRLETDRVWFIVKKNVDSIKRENFNNPQREDEYGTSVLSIQFSRGKNSVCSIKCRYNHKVYNPDCTFKNNLDNIIPGLAEAFCRDYGIKISSSNSRKFELHGYVKANNGVLYKCHSQTDDIAYCSNNVVIRDGEPEVLIGNKLLLDGFVFDSKNRTITSEIEDSFLDAFSGVKIKNIGIENNTVTIKIEGQKDVIITYDNNHRITSYHNENITKIDSDYCGFLSHCKGLKEVSLPNVTEVGERFLSGCKNLESLSMQNLRKCGDEFCAMSQKMKELKLPNLTDIGNRFLYVILDLEVLELPSARVIGNEFCEFNQKLTRLSLPNVVRVGSEFLLRNKVLNFLEMPKVEKIGNDFCSENEKLLSLHLPSVTKVGNEFLSWNDDLEDLELPNVRVIGDGFCAHNATVKKFYGPEIIEIGDGFFMYNYGSIRNMILPNVKEIGDDFLYINPNYSLIAPNLEKMGELQSDYIKKMMPHLVKQPEKFVDDDSMGRDDFDKNNGNNYCMGKC